MLETMIEIDIACWLAVVIAIVVGMVVELHKRIMR